ncbi:protein cramped [Drosophila grimshawi]|uniref:GH12275 n=1 Tax=Drosophila grimshawi TaxID=7222 RepID=B4JJD9_DROGR|nr:protein cramped [Drosophila grimshawi]EDV99691.1 GH12275 [Drosophila grimshawi]
MEDNGSMCKNVKIPADAAVVVNAITAPPAAPAPPNGKVLQIKQAAGGVTEPPEELLGSVTSQNCPGTRASARVIQKMKLDQTRPMTPPPAEREPSKKDEKAAQKTPSQMRAANKSTWSNVERNCFFDALNEFGKDFETMANYINSKLKRRNMNSDYSFKSKDQVRQHYYQTYHKIAKYVRYSDELRKPAQELYTLINYGEMRRKLQFITDKHFMKLKHLIYQGHITVRCKGKNIRIKTPSCKALRRLNQLDDTLEDIRLPTKIEVLVSPANMEAFGRVQSLAQNPRIRITVPLHKKLISFIQSFQYKWRSSDARLAEKQPPPPLLNGIPDSSSIDSVPVAEPALCFLPKPGVAIHRPLLSITAHLSSVNICLTAYEERLGFKVRSETLESTAAAAAASAKRARTESGSEKRSPDTKKQKPLTSSVHDKSLNELMIEGSISTTSNGSTSNHMKLESNSGDELMNEELSELLNLTINGVVDSTAVGSISAAPLAAPQAIALASISTAVAAPAAAPPASQPAPAPPPQPAPAPAPTPTRAKRSDAPGAGGGKNAKANAAAAAARNFRPLLSDDVIKRMRKGWTISSAADITIGDLYVVLGQDAKLELDYYWCDVELSTPNIDRSSIAVTNSSSTTTTSITTNSTAVTTASSGSILTNTNTSSSSSATNSASTALPYNVNDCDSVERVKAITTATVSNKLKHLLLISNLSERVRKRQCSCGHSCDRKRDLITKAQSAAAAAAGSGSAAATAAAAVATTTPDGSEIIFRTPMLPVRRPMANIIDPGRQLSKLTRQKMSRHVLVQRLLQPDSGSQPYDLLNMQNGLFEPIERVNSNSSTTIVASVSSKNTSRIITTASNIPFQIKSEQCYSSSSSRDSGNQYANMPSLDMPSLDMPSLEMTSSDMPTLADPAVEHASLPATCHALPDSVQDDSTMHSLFNGNVSPNHLLRDSTSNSRWLDDNINDFSLTSLLGHLDDIDATRDILDPSSSLSVISETSVDYRHKFQEISALLQQQEKD